ncbi:MAG: hypothetical protein HY318_16645, partial [Armatimonadetes bacterium]|nr:hypothetical protein [Armatimonadota bacterium]
FSKNYAIDEEEYVLTKQMRDFCRKHGIKVGVYIRGDFIYSEFFGDLLKKEDVLAEGADGRVPTIGYGVDWRKSVCLHKPKTMEMFKSDIRRAVVDLKVDYLHFDGWNFGGMETINACRCETCLRDFTEFLQRRYGDNPEACLKRFGHTHLEAIEAPGLRPQPLAPAGLISDPAWQEWISFRCTWSARIARTVFEYVYSLNPEVAIGVNIGVPVRENGALLLGADLVTCTDGADILMNEDAYGPYITDDGKIIQRARQHKMGHEAGCWAWNYVGKPQWASQWGESSWIGLSHASAFNKGRVTYLGEAESSFLAWQKEHWEHFQDLEEIVDIAVWRERKAMAWADPMSYATAMQVEQMLIEERIPFTVAQHAWPAGTKVLVLPVLTCLDAPSCRKAVEFAEQGGGVMIVGNTSLRDGWGRKREDFGLRPILPEGVAGPPVSTPQYIAAVNGSVGGETEQLADHGAFKYRKVGKGRVVYVSGLVNPESQPSLFNPDHTFNLDLDTTNWRVPEDADNLRRALSWLGGNQWSAQVESVRGVLANYYRQKTTGNRSVHLVNLTGKPVANTVVRMRIVEADTLTVMAISPDGPPYENVDWQCSGNELTIAMERLKAYTVIIVSSAVRGNPGGE